MKIKEKKTNKPTNKRISSINYIIHLHCWKIIKITATPIMHLSQEAKSEFMINQPKFVIFRGLLIGNHKVKRNITLNQTSSHYWQAYELNSFDAPTNSDEHVAMYWPQFYQSHKQAGPFRANLELLRIECFRTWVVFWDSAKWWTKLKLSSLWENSFDSLTWTKNLAETSIL